MKLDDISELYQLISDGSKSNPSRKQAILLRKAGLESHVSGQGFTKVAFDTRRIDQETEYNPRRGLQNYNRSEAFLTEALSHKLISLAKLRGVLEDLKEEYGREHEWQDSNARILLSTLNNGLRKGINDDDFSSSQPAQGSLDYIEELLHVRYRLAVDDLVRLGEKDLRKVILSKDEELTRKGVKQALEITKGDVEKQNYDTLMDKLFSGCRASEDNPDVERTITITIRDRFHKES
jgi:hypothetical protein